MTNFVITIYRTIGLTMLFELNEYVDCLMSILTAEKVFRDPVRQHMIDCSVKWSVEFTSQKAYIGLTLR